jgi:hypothetical protein
MCKRVCDTTTSIDHDMWVCYCEDSCFRCKESTGMSSTQCWYKWDPPRQKFVCFNCKHIWKWRWSKYMMRTVEWDKFCKINLKTDAHLDSRPGCSKCGRAGIHVGENFRHCRNDKEWEILIQKYNSGEIDMIAEFEGSAVRPKYTPI